MRECKNDLSTWYELVSEGDDYLSLEQWLRAIDGRQLLADLSVKGHSVRLTEPQARGAFLLAAAEPMRGLLPDELVACVVKTACDKFKTIEMRTNGNRFTNGDKVMAFCAIMLGVADEEEVLSNVMPAPGYVPPPASDTPKRATPAAGKRAPSPRAAPAAAAPAPAAPKAPPAPTAAERDAAAVIDSLLPAEFFTSLGGAASPLEIADVMDAISQKQPALRTGLAQKQGVQLFTALDTRGDGQMAQPPRGELARAVASQQPLLDFFKEASKSAVALS